MPRFEVGALVKCRARDWVVLPSDEQDEMILRPLGGSEIEISGIYLPLEGNDLAETFFPMPEPSLAGDFVSGQLLYDGSRLTLRNGSGPFRSLGRLGVRPRPYQLVPLLMGLRLNPVRLLIADDVGVGKTIEAGVLVRELFDRGEIRRLTVLCPPHLCDQWQRELREKFAFDAVIVRSNTVARLHRGLSQSGMSIFEQYPITVASIDYVKNERHRADFLRACPPCVIVDEAHTATLPRGGGGTQQQRYELVREVAADPRRHLVLLTATPHSGIEDSFQSLLGLLNPSFATLDLAHLSDAERDTLARHFIQRRRADVVRWLGEETPFPQRQSAEVPYALPPSSPYRLLFDDVYRFARQLIRGQEDTPAYRQRVRYWAALALLRCVMSSPAAAEKALRARASSASAGPRDDNEPPAPPAWVQGDEQEIDDLLSSYVTETADQEGTHDTEPSHLVEQGCSTSERARLRKFAARARDLRGANDPKLQAAMVLVRNLLEDDYHPIIYCRYIATANYLAEELRNALSNYGHSLRVLSITGERSEEERETLVDELCQTPRRVLVATDCLSEGINLQSSFDAVVHYDLPWNPNRLEQREGRVDRYGQRRSTIRTAIISSKDNPMDEAVMGVLLRKAVEIHRTLGISVPLPTSSKEVLETLIGSLFQPSAEQLSFLERAHQMSLGEIDEPLRAIEQQWNQAVVQERESRTRFAQRRIKPAEVAREMDESSAVLGDASTVERFVQNACERLGGPLVQETTPQGRWFRLPLSQLPTAVRERIAAAFVPHPAAPPPDEVAISFVSPPPEHTHAIGRNHPLTVALAEYLLETALLPYDPEAVQEVPPAARSSIIRSSAVAERTTLLLLRVRMLLESRAAPTPMLAEELVVTGYRGSPRQTVWLDEAGALDLLSRARPDANMEPEERKQGMERAMAQVREMTDDLNRLANERAEHLCASHQRVRRAVGSGPATTVRPHLPPDVLGVYVLLPMISTR
jgi:superfamily II DNA or RNA helicase